MYKRRFLPFLWILLFSQFTSADSGFLTHYEVLGDSPVEGSAQVWVKPGFGRDQLKGYTKILIDPPEVWYHPDSPNKGIAVRELNDLVNYLEQTFTTALGEHYQIVHEPDPQTLRIRLALTNFKRAKPDKTALDYIPFRLAMNLAKDAIRSSQNSELIVVNLTLESEFLDSLTNERLAMAVDKQQSDSLTLERDDPAPWWLVKSTLDDWATRLAGRLSHNPTD